MTVEHDPACGAGVGQHLSAANRDVKSHGDKTGLPIKGRPAWTKKIVAGVTGEHGRTELFKSEQMGTGSTRLVDDEK